MLSVIHVQIRHPSKSSSSKRRLQQSCYCSRFSSSAIMNHSFLAPYKATIGDSVQGSPLLLNKWESPSSHCKWFRLLGPCLAPGLGPSSQDHHRSSDASSDLALAVAFQGALSRTIRSWRWSCDYRRLRSRESPSPLQVGVAFKGFPLSIVNGFASRGSPSPSGWDSPQGVSPSLQRMGFASRESPSPSVWIHLKGFPLSSANGFASWGSPSPKLHSEWNSLQGSPSSKANGIRFRGVPSSKANGIRLLEVPPYPGGSLLQVNEIHLKGLPLSTANGIRFKGVPFSKENGIRLKGVPLSNANESRLKGFSSSPMRMGFASSGSPSPKRMIFASRDSPSPQWQCFASTNPTSSRHQHSSRASSEDNPFERPHLRPSPTIHLPFQRR